jgi:hypothetical protein
MTARGARLESAWAVLGQYPARVERAKLPAGGLRLTLLAQGGGLLKFAVAMVLVGVLGVVVWVFLVDQPRTSHLGAGRMKLIVMSISCITLAPALLLVRIVTGPPKPTVLEIRPGELRLDHYIAGDHIVRTYSATELRSVRATKSEVIIETRLGFVVVGNNLGRAARGALMEVINAVLWGE